MLRFPTVVRTVGYSVKALSGPDALINPEQVAAVEPFIYGYDENQAHATQSLSVISLASGARIELFATVDQVASALANAATH